MVDLRYNFRKLRNFVQLQPAGLISEMIEETLDEVSEEETANQVEMLLSQIADKSGLGLMSGLLPKNHLLKKIMTHQMIY